MRAVTVDLDQRRLFGDGLFSYDGHVSKCGNIIDQMLGAFKVGVFDEMGAVGVEQFKNNSAQLKVQKVCTNALWHTWFNAT